MKLAVRLLLLIAAVYGGMNVLMYANQRNYMYLPSVDRIAPTEAGLNNVAEIVLRTASNDELISWYAAALQGQPTVLFFHGNAGAVYHRAYRIKDLQVAGFGVFILGYPGYGGSGGRPTEGSMVEAAQLAYDHLLDAGLSANDIVIWGESIGTGVGVQLAATVDAKALILEAPMSSASDVAAVHYPYMIARFLMKDKFASVASIDKIGMPLLVMHGDRDRVIPLELGRKLVESAVEPKTLVVVEGAGHNDLYQYSTNAIAQQFIRSP